jgi:pilus assembly protein CpaB
MNIKTLLPLGVAGVLGTIAAIFAFDMTGSGPAPAAAKPSDTATIVVVAVDVAPGVRLAPEHLKTAQVEPSLAGAGTFADPQQVVGRVTRMKLPTGMVVLDSLLAPTGTAAGLQAILPNGYRAITLRIDEVSGVAGFLVPGARIDVVSTISGRDGRESQAIAVVQNVPVIAVGTRVTPGQPRQEGEPITSVTLAVTPEQAQKVELIASTSQTRLLLRSFGDESMLSSVGVTTDQLLAKQDDGKNENTTPISTDSNDPFGTPMPSTQPTQPSGERYRTVVVIRGGVETEVKVPLPPELPRVQPVVANTSDEPQPTTRPARSGWTFGFFGD